MTAEKLNKLENGIANGSGTLYAHVKNVSGTVQLDVTFNEIVAAIEGGANVILYYDMSQNEGEIAGFLGTLVALTGGGSTYFVCFVMLNTDTGKYDFQYAFSASTPDAPLVLNTQSSQEG